MPVLDARPGHRGAPRRIRARCRPRSSCSGSRRRRSARAGAPYTSVYMYMLHGEELVLEAYAGRDTEHTRIAVGQGVCGTAVATGTDQNVPDVRAMYNYIACNTWTRSELVVLIRRGEHDPGPDRRGQRRARPLHARRRGGGPKVADALAVLL